MSNNSSNDFKPYISTDKVMPELSISSIIIGVVLAVVFCAANAYLGLRVGSTISACIPISVISMGIYKGMFKKNSILENNMVQTIGSIGEAIAAGMIFTVPALFLWYKEWNLPMPDLKIMILLPLVGGILGILFMIPLRKALIVEEHATLPYPEGTACAEVLIAAEQGGGKAKTAFIGVVVGSVYKFIADGLKLFPSKITAEFSFFKGAGIGMEALPALLGVGFIVGRQIACFMLAGAVLGWFVILPIIYQFGSLSDVVIYPATVPIAQLDLMGLWGNYLRYIGAGAVACSGIFNLIKSLPVIIKTFKGAVSGYGKAGKNENTRTQQDLSMNIVILGVILVLILLSVFDIVPVGWFGAFLILFFGFFFSTVASKMVGVVGSSNNPVSGMTIATLLITTIIFKAFGLTSQHDIVTVFYIGSIICITAAVAGGTSQSLKTGFLVGATPKKQQIGTMLGLVASAFVVGSVLNLLNSAWEFGSNEIPAPQATLTKLVVEGVMGGKLPWFLVFAGVGIVIFVEILGLQTMSFSLGLFLPISLSVPIAIGGFIKGYFDDRIKKGDNDLIDRREDGVLFSSGLIAGEGLIGILLAIFAVSNINLAVSGSVLFNDDATLVFFFILCLLLLRFSLWNKRKPKQ